MTSEIGSPKWSASTTTDGVVWNSESSSQMSNVPSALTRYFQPRNRDTRSRNVREDSVPVAAAHTGDADSDE